MKKMISIMVCLCMLAALVPAPVHSAGGAGPFFASCCIGPRVGLEMNEGKSIKSIEWTAFIVNLFLAPIGNLIAAISLGGPNGTGGFFASCCIGPRVGEQLKKRRIRTWEWLRLVPVVNIVSAVVVAVEAGSGKTMVDIESKESLKK